MTSLLLLFAAILSLFYQGSLASITNGCCPCGKFSPEQAGQLSNLLKAEAGSLRKGMQMMCPKRPSRWHRLNVTRSCFGAKDDKPAIFTIPTEGFVAAFKVVHIRGQVTCDTDSCHRTHGHASFHSKWGCSTSHPYVGTTPLGTFITTPTKRVLFPREKFIRDKSMSTWYALPGFEPDSPFLVFHDFSNPEFFRHGQQVQFMVRRGSGKCQRKRQRRRNMRSCLRLVSLNRLNLILNLNLTKRCKTSSM
ncbi:hypothetical protein OS493_009859 [Desmophyllum pertusum]|uniref:Uncharacterized protein n=1 Tax=Desmophyllum pertusum TaxID=174260 RepID=A0A9X0CM38_9CNID|nr:hypothetical protein OS493_009859 [Desmophyllum pertusum]